MSRQRKLLLFATTLIALTFVASACDVGLPWVDCSWIDQPDMGGLVCAGGQVLALQATLSALILALVFGIGSAVG